MPSNRIPDNIWNFISQQHVVAVTASAAGELWSACLFYAPHNKTQTLYVLTEETTRHARLMLENNIISGTIHNNTREAKQIQGIQFKGFITKLNDPEMFAAREYYQQQFRIASSLPPHPVWKITMTEIKFTDNTETFGSKYYWNPE
ncbi:PNPOx family protein [Filimonas effusa]|uniref:Pyridoxamine 5'-phosphate oxidase putative domain-containing protein n=1 Tax=Filimonas effusa TaxID=2508721 RepID=A0A4V1MAM5_9BACT|nr:pyridoxamine 5'-phosphate oxidase family protein [Filimonas effusa]RXK86396.1 hypothetical protein ESB13_06215 [Filimonas effusa]